MTEAVHSDTPAASGVPSWFWIVSVLALLWELMGVGSYLYHVTLSPEAIAALPEGQAELMRITPAWVNGAFAVATFGGLLGAVGLLLRRQWARLLFIVSLVAVVVQFGWVFLVGKAHELIGPSSAVFPAFIVAVAAVLVWFAGTSIRRGWLR